MRLKDVQGRIDLNNHSVSARIPDSYYKYIKEKNINLRRLIIKAIDEIRGETK